MNNDQADLIHLYFFSEKIESLDTKPLLDFLDKFGGWPVVKSNLWSPGSFDVIQTIAKLTHYDYHIFVSANVEASFDDSTLNVMLVCLSLLFKL